MQGTHPLHTLESMVLVAIGGFAGSNLRYFVETIVSGPVGTLLVNVVGSFALGLVTFAGVGAELVLSFVTGACGSFTTFSFETFRLVERDEWAKATANAAVNLLGSLGAIGFAWLFVHAVFG